MAAELSRRLGTPPCVIGRPEPVLGAGWREELDAALPGLRALATHLGEQTGTRRPITALNRCAASLATLPVMARRWPDLCVVWFDAHADLNTPGSSETGYLGGLALSGPMGL